MRRSETMDHFYGKSTQPFCEKPLLALGYGRSLAHHFVSESLLSLFVRTRKVHSAGSGGRVFPRRQLIPKRMSRPYASKVPTMSGPIVKHPMTHRKNPTFRVASERLRCSRSIATTHARVTPSTAVAMMSICILISPWARFKCRFDTSRVQNGCR